MDDYATKLMNESIDVNYIDETEYPRVAVMAARCVNIMANLWNSPEQAQWKAGALAIGSSGSLYAGRRSRFGCAGVRNAKRRANRTTNRTSSFRPVSRSYGKNSVSCGKSKCVPCP